MQDIGVIRQRGSVDGASRRRGIREGAARGRSIQRVIVLHAEAGPMRNRIEAASAFDDGFNTAIPSDQESSS
jgi:hypothetical protein